MWFLVYNRPNFSAKHIYVDICILAWKICIALYAALNAASSINSSYLDFVWYHIKLLKDVVILRTPACMGPGCPLKPHMSVGPSGAVEAMPPTQQTFPASSPVAGGKLFGQSWDKASNSSTECRREGGGGWTGSHWGPGNQARQPQTCPRTALTQQGFWTRPSEGLVGGEHLKPVRLILSQQNLQFHDFT